MKSYQRIVVFILLVLLLTSLVSPWVAALWGWILDAHPAWEDYRYPFSRIFDRLFMVLGIGLFFLYRPLLKIESFGQLGLTPPRQGYRDLLKGFFFAVGSVAALVTAMSFNGAFEPYFRLAPSEAFGRIFKALMAGLTVGLLEEIFFRGMIFKGLVEDLRLFNAFVITNIFYSAIHFVKPAQKVPLSGIDPWAGIRHLVSSFQPFLDLRELLPGLIGLFVLGVVLSYAFLRTRSLYLSIGLHAGWVFGIKTMRVYGDYQREDLGWIFGSTDPKVVSGVASWIGILIVGIIIHCVTRRRNPSLPQAR